MNTVGQSPIGTVECPHCGHENDAVTAAEVAGFECYECWTVIRITGTDVSGKTWNWEADSSDARSLDSLAQEYEERAYEMRRRQRERDAIPHKAGEA